MTHIAADEKPDRRILMRAWLTQLRIQWCSRESLIASDVVYVTGLHLDELPKNKTLTVKDMFREINFKEAANMLLEGDLLVMTSGGRNTTDGFWFRTSHGVALETADTSIDQYGVYTTPRRIGYDLPTEWLDIRDIDLFYSQPPDSFCIRDALGTDSEPLLSKHQRRKRR